jgi:hypothetical protein
MNDREREERAVWKLEQAGEGKMKAESRELKRATTKLTAPMFHLSAFRSLLSLAQLAAFADAIYADHWTGRKITPSA